jgi:hypothetical protein
MGTLEIIEKLFILLLSLFVSSINIKKPRKFSLVNFIAAEALYPLLTSADKECISCAFSLHLETTSEAKQYCTTFNSLYTRLFLFLPLRFILTPPSYGHYMPG